MRRSLTSDMRRLRKTLTYLLTYLRDPLLDFGTLSVSLKRLKLITNIADYHKEHYQTYAKLGHRVMTGVRYSFLEFYDAYIFGTFEGINSNLVRRCKIAYSWGSIDQYRNRK